MIVSALRSSNQAGLRQNKFFENSASSDRVEPRLRRDYMGFHVPRTNRLELHTRRESPCAKIGVDRVESARRPLRPSFKQTPLYKHGRFQCLARTRYVGCVCKNMRLRMNDRRARRLENLLDATGEKTKSKAIDKAADYYLKMAGETTAQPNGSVTELMELAVEQGSVTPAEIADVLNTDELPVEARTTWSVGRERDEPHV